MSGMQCGQDPNPPCHGLNAHSDDIQKAGLHSLESENLLMEFRVAARNALHR